MTAESLPRVPAAPSADAAGAYAGRLERLTPAAMRPPATWLARLFTKRWMYLVAISDAALAAVAVVDGGWFAGAFAWAVDRATGAVVLDASGAGLPGIHGHVDDRTGPGAHARFVARGLAVHIERDAGGWTFHVETPQGRVEASLDVDPSTQPFTLVAPVPGGRLRVTEKSAALPASGSVRLPDRALSLERGYGGVDVTAGVLARETSWRWAFASGAVGRRAVGFNLCQGFGVPPGERGENALFRDASPAALPPVAIEPGLAEWRIASDDGAVDLRFRPAAAHRERRDLAVLRTRFTQLAGTFHGRIAALDGTALDIAGLPGVCEDHWAVW